MDESQFAPRFVDDDVGTVPVRNETSDTQTPDESRSSLDELTSLDRGASSRVWAMGGRIFGYVALLAGGLPAVAARPAAAQSSVGSELCGTPIADFINSTVPLVVLLVQFTKLFTQTTGGEYRRSRLPPRRGLTGLQLSTLPLGYTSQSVAGYRGLTGIAFFDCSIRSGWLGRTESEPVHVHARPRHIFETIHRGGKLF